MSIRIEDLFFELLRVAIGNADCLSHNPTDKEWKALYDMAKKQSLVGVCFAGVQKLALQDQAPEEMLYLTWMGMAAKIQQRNEVVNRQCVDLQKLLSAEGLRSCVLKGQGVGLLYFEHLRSLRQSGDIDIWVEGGFEKVRLWMMAIEKDCDFDDHHAHLHIFDDTDVEVHYTPSTLRNPFANARLQKWFSAHSTPQFDNKCYLGTKVIYVPTSDFNLIYQMTHVFNHFFSAGVGFRQLMDYYFVLCDANKTGLNASNKFQEVTSAIHQFGFTRFASALMWVLGYVYGLNEEYMLLPPNEKFGKILLREVIQSGNFGKTDERMKGLYDNAWNQFWKVHVKTIRLWRFDNTAWFWSPLYRISSFLWQKTRGYK